MTYQELAKNANVQGYLDGSVKKIPKNKEEEIVALYEQSKCDDFESFIKYIIRGMINGCSLNQIITSTKFLLEKKVPIDFTKAFSMNLMKKYQVTRCGLLMPTEYEKLAKKPTLDNLCKILNI
jgi:hypothetical protein